MKNKIIREVGRWEDEVREEIGFLATKEMCEEIMDHVRTVLLSRSSYPKRKNMFWLRAGHYGYPDYPQDIKVRKSKGRKRGDKIAK
ncbi:hypothetical protein A2911_00120 [Candidatus Nomurabacteria bacterium RIFCSPLOWO2_01_FULL_40_15]|uniref:Uncharacterized protein n=1 Tax=Candidatus Nomurabacteria bacterium RIFCSPLOWO2_01_FULL_40_15 TaxID=1801772 RepID=A0A1F6X8L9_9BACT|nr:MAG: hypothetical protein A2911_00120 [Candidatus Nomurabacteria bacterium RIFCSPLOWO2_01_FULL_40_15]